MKKHGLKHRETTAIEGEACAPFALSSGSTIYAW